MRPLRALSIILALVVAIPVALTDGSSARAQSVEEAEENAALARERAEVASGLVDGAVANRSQIELDLAATIEHLNVLADELTELSVDLDRTSEQIGFADLELAGIQTDIEVRAVDAYMNALSGASMAVVTSRSVEEAMVAGRAVEEIIGSEHQEIEGLVVKRRDLEKLQAELAAQQQAVASKQAEYDQEVAHLAELFALANQEVADAVLAASIADQEYRAALGEVAVAEARAAAETRGANEDTTTTTQPSGSVTTTTTASASTTTIGGGEYPWTPPPQVEQWRGLVSQFFPSNRVDEALHIMSCESGGDPDAYNIYSGASGLFQFIPSTWASTAPAAGYPGASPFDPEANIASAAWLANQYQKLGLYYWQAWSCKRVLP